MTLVYKLTTRYSDLTIGILLNTKELLPTVAISCVLFQNPSLLCIDNYMNTKFKLPDYLCRNNLCFHYVSYLARVP